jgi:site-specific DNA recombinase
MTCAVIYARFSTELQSEKSTEDQIALYRAYAARIGLDFIGTYEDRARSGASGMSVHDRDKTGKTRIRCSAARENGSCSNRRIFYLQDVEEAVLRGMTEELKDTRLIETYVRAYNEERKRLAATAISRRTRIERRCDRLEAERQRAIDMLIKGVLREEEGRARLDELRGQVLEAERELSQVEETPQIIALHPATLGSYIATVDRLASVLTEHSAAEDDRGSLVSTFRALVYSVTVHPKAPREGFQVEVKGKLAALIGGEAFPRAKYSGGRVVAEEGFEPPTQGL